MSALSFLAIALLILLFVPAVLAAALCYLSNTVLHQDLSFPGVYILFIVLALFGSMLWVILREEST